MRVNPRVEQSILNNRTKNSAFDTPDNTDELLHLVCRGVFDYEGEFPEYYIERCVKLHNEVDDDQRARLLELLSEVFYKADRVVYDCIRSEEYNEIRTRLRQFSNY